MDDPGNAGPSFRSQIIFESGNLARRSREPPAYGRSDLGRPLCHFVSRSAAVPGPIRRVAADARGPCAPVRRSIRRARLAAVL